MKSTPDSIQPTLPGLEREEGRGPSTAKDVMKDAFRIIERLYEGKSEQPPRGLPLGFAELDRWIIGLKESEMTVIGSRPGTGKTLFALHVAFHAANRFSVPVLFFSPETKGVNLILRMLSVIGQVSATRITTGAIDENDWPKLTTAAGRLCDAPVFIDDSPDITVQDVRHKAMLARERTGLGLIIVDGLESVRVSRMDWGSETDNFERARLLKCIARSLDVPVILTANLERNLSSDTNRRPALSDLLDQHIEIFADLILLLHRDTMTVLADRQKTDRTLIDVNVAKNRGGPTGRVRLILDHQYLDLIEQGQPSFAK